MPIYSFDRENINELLEIRQYFPVKILRRMVCLGYHKEIVTNLLTIIHSIILRHISSVSNTGLVIISVAL